MLREIRKNTEYIYEKGLLVGCRRGIAVLSIAGRTDRAAVLEFLAKCEPPPADIPRLGVRPRRPK